MYSLVLKTFKLCLKILKIQQQPPLKSVFKFKESVKKIKRNKKDKLSV